MELAQASPQVAPSAEPVIAESTEEDPDRTITLEELKAMNLDYQTHCMEALPGEKPNLYFVWKHGGTRVAVWGSFNNWSRAIPLFYDGSTEMFVAFTECEDVQEGETCIFKFSVDDEWKVDPELEIIVDDEDGSQYNAILICSQYYQGSQVEATYEPVRYKVLPRLMRTTSVEYVLDSDDLGSAVNDARIQDSIEVLESERNLQKLRMQFSTMENASMSSLQVEEVQVSLKELVDVPLSESVTETVGNDDDSYDVVTAPSEVQSVDGSIEPTESTSSSRGELVDVLDTVPEIEEATTMESIHSPYRLTAENVSQIQVDAENTAAVLLQDIDFNDWEGTASFDDVKDVNTVADPMVELETIIGNQERLIDEALLSKDTDNVEALMIELINNLENTLESQEKVVDLLVAQKSVSRTTDVKSVPLELSSELKTSAEDEEAVHLQSLDAEKLVESEKTDTEMSMATRSFSTTEYVPPEVAEEAKMAAEFEEAVRLQAVDAEKLDLLVSPLVLPEQAAPSPTLQVSEDQEQNAEEATRIIEVDDQQAYVLPDVVRDSIRLTVESEYEQELTINQTQSAKKEIMEFSLPEDIRQSIRIEAEADVAMILQENEVFVKDILEDVMENAMLVSEEQTRAVIVDSGRHLQHQDEQTVETREIETVAVHEPAMDNSVIVPNDALLSQQFAEEIVKDIVERALEPAAELKDAIRIRAEEAFAVELQQEDHDLQCEEFAGEIVHDIVERALAPSVEEKDAIRIRAEEALAIELQQEDHALQCEDEPLDVSKPLEDSAFELADSQKELVDDKFEDFVETVPSDHFRTRKIDSAEETVLNQIIEEMNHVENDDASTTPRLLQVEIPEIAFEAPLTPSETNEDTPAPPSPARTPSEREILILTPDSAEIIPIPSHLLSPQAGVIEELIETHAVEEVNGHDGISLLILETARSLPHLDIAGEMEEADYMSSPPRASPRSENMLPSILEVAEELTPVENDTTINRHTEWVQVPLPEPSRKDMEKTTVSEKKSGSMFEISPPKILLGLLLFSQYELILSVGNIGMKGFSSAVPYTFESLRGLGYVYLVVGLLAVLRELL
jgi:hypothetical protein